MLEKLFKGMTTLGWAAFGCSIGAGLLTIVGGIFSGVDKMQKSINNRT